MDKDALFDIRQMIIVATRTAESMGEAIHQQRPEAFETLSFSLHDALRRVTELEDGSTTTVEVGKVSDAGEKPENRWTSAQLGMEGFLCEAVHMAQITDGRVDDVDRDDSDSREQLSLVVGLTRKRLEDLRRRFYEDD